MMEKITLANLPNQELIKTKADQILGRLNDQTIVAKSVKAVYHNHIKYKASVKTIKTGKYEYNLPALPTTDPRHPDNSKRGIISINIPTVKPERCFVIISGRSKIFDVDGLDDYVFCDLLPNQLKVSTRVETSSVNSGPLYFSYTIIEFY